MKIQHIVLAIVIVVFWSCQKNNNNASKPCGDYIIVDLDQELFLQDSPDNFIITNAFISENCITIEVSASGCDPLTWQAVLITDGLETNSIPSSRLLRLKLTTNQECLAVFPKPFTFNINNEDQTVIYYLDGWIDNLVHN